MAARKTTRSKPRSKPRPKARRKPARRKPLSARLRSFSPGRLRVSELEDSHRDALALALVGLGLLMAFVFYFGWEGGKVGEAFATALRFLFGAAAYVIPVGLISCGLAVIGTTDHSPRRHLAIGSAILLGSLSLGYAAGSLGLGPGATPRAD